MTCANKNADRWPASLTNLGSGSIGENLTSAFACEIFGPGKLATMAAPQKKRSLSNVFWIDACSLRNRSSLEWSLKLVSVIIDEGFPLQRITHPDFLGCGQGFAASSGTNKNRANLLFFKLLFFRRCKLAKEKPRIIFSDAPLFLGRLVPDQHCLRLNNTDGGVLPPR